MKRALALLILLGACAPAPPPDSYRDNTVPLSVTTRGALTELAGDWTVRGTYPNTASLDSVGFAPRGDDRINVTITQTGCEQDCHILSGTWPAQPIAQNRMRLLTDSTSDPELWVIWMDEGVRTAVIVTPDGRNAFILDRKAQGGADRIEAARTVLEFNGYDISALQMR
jgi:apolipoprotein D and lipocalin family protein